MRWVAIDFGRNEIKAAVTSVDGKPMKLLYNNNGRMYSYMPSEGYISNNGRVYMGMDLPVVGALSPERISEIKNSHERKVLLNKAFENINEAAISHYDDNSIGAVLLYENIKEDEKNEDSIYSIAKSHFEEVQQKCASEVLTSVLYSNEGTSVVIDISLSALQMSLVVKGVKKAYIPSNELGFKTVDISEIIGYTIPEDISDGELYLHGLILENIRQCLCQGKVDFALLDVLDIEPANEPVIRNKFEECMTRYLFRCFDVCTQKLRKQSMSWSDVNNIVLCGSASNYYKMKDGLCRFLKGNGADTNTIKITVYDKDAQWAAAFNTLNLPLLEEGGVIVEF